MCLPNFSFLELQVRSRMLSVFMRSFCSFYNPQPASNTLIYPPVLMLLCKQKADTVLVPTQLKIKASQCLNVTYRWSYFPEMCIFKEIVLLSSTVWGTSEEILLSQIWFNLFYRGIQRHHLQLGFHYARRWHNAEEFFYFKSWWSVV